MVPKKFSLIGIAAIVLLGSLIYLFASSVAFTTRRATLLAKPNPIPDQIAAVEPAPGSHIPSGLFNRDNNGVGAICFQVYGDLLGHDLTKVLPSKQLDLSINARPAIGYWPGERHAFGVSIEQSPEIRGLWSRICWYVKLAPDEYLATLAIRGITETLTYDWAFEITDK